MAGKIFKDYQGESIRVGGVCHIYNGETVSSVNTSPNVIEATFASCLECTIEESSSQSSESIGNFSSSTSSFNYSESTSESSEGYTTSSSTSSESFNNFSSSTSSEMFSDVTSSSSESILNTSSSSESDDNFSSSQSDGCVSVEILDIRTSQKLLVFAPGPPLLNLAEGQACVNGTDIGTLDTGQSSNAIYFSTLGITNNYTIGEIVDVCEGECCYKGNYTKRCIYNLNEVTSVWELSGSDNQRTNACDLDFKCGLENQVYQIHQFETLEQRNNFNCPTNPIGDVPIECYGNFSSSEGLNSSSSSECDLNYVLYSSASSDSEAVNAFLFQPTGTSVGADEYWFEDGTLNGGPLYVKVTGGVLKVHNTCGRVIDNSFGASGWLAKVGTGAPTCSGQESWTLALMKSLVTTEWQVTGQPARTSLCTYLGDVEGPNTSFTEAQSGIDLLQWAFTDTTSVSTPIISWSWSIGGSPYSTQNPVHTFPSEGTYTVTLTVSDSVGLDNTFSKQIVVGCHPLSESSESSSSSESAGVPLAIVNGDGNTDPRMKVTMCGGGGYPKNWIGQSWADGESKIICPETYINGSFEQWRYQTSIGNRIFLVDIQSSADAGLALNGKPSTLNFDLKNEFTFGPNLTLSNVASASTISGANLGTDANLFNPPSQFSAGFDNTFFGSLTLTDGTTIKWSPISGSGQPWDSWKGAGVNLSYVPTTGNEACP